MAEEAPTPRAEGETPINPGDSPSSTTEDPSSGAHIEGIALEGETFGPEEPDPQGDAWAGMTDGQGFLKREAWIDLFCKAHALPGHALQLQTLILAPDQPTTREAGGAFYDICRDTPALHWMIRPGSAWFQRIGAIGIWGISLYVGCSMELAERKRQARAAAGARPKGAGTTAKTDDAAGGFDYADDYKRAQEAQGNVAGNAA
jgi:hypothetical protein